MYSLYMRVAKTCTVHEPIWKYVYNAILVMDFGKFAIYTSQLRNYRIICIVFSEVDSAGIGSWRR